jgi:putative Ca2+/H+ antiporter (TMEM165/GDT1 family)
VLIAIAIALIGISVYSSVFPEKEALELKLNVISILSGFSYLIFALVIWNLYGKKQQSS